MAKNNEVIKGEKMMKRIAVLFPGQGSQYVGMGKTLCENYHVAKEVFVQADDILNMNLRQICCLGSIRELSDFSNTLLAIFVMNVASYKVFEEIYGFTPLVGAGHSLGELSALVCSGIADFEHMLELVRYRSKLAIEQKQYGHMTIVNDCTKEYLEDICTQYNSEIEPISIVCYNSKNQFVIAGHKKGLLEIEKLLKKEHIKITPLLNSPPLHSSIMNVIVDFFKKEALKLHTNTYKWPVIANCDAEAYTTEGGIASKLSQQLVKPVLWTECISNMIKMGTEVFVEIGPQSLLTEINRQNHIMIPSYSFLQKNDREELEKFLTQKKAFGRNYAITVVTKCLSAAVSVKNNNPDIGEYQTEVIEPYHKVSEMQKIIQKYDNLPTKEQEEEAIEMLRRVLRGKQVSLPESEEILKDILELHNNN